MRLLLVLALLGWGLGGCAAPEQQQMRPPLRSPAIEDEAFIASDGARLPLAAWLPEKDVRAVIVALHGFNDSRHGFAMPGPYWAGRGIAVYAYDQRGFGAAPGRGIWAGNDLLARDFRELAVLLRRRYPQRPIAVVGQSMGAAVALYALGCGKKRCRDTVDGVVLSGPGVWGRESMPALYRASLWLTVHTFPALRASGRGLGILPSDNIPMLRERARDPLTIIETRFDATYGLLGLMDAALERAPRLNAPVLLLYGKRDQLIPRTAIDLLRRRLPPGYRYIEYEKGWHMLLRDLQAPRVWRDIADWVLQLGPRS